MAKENSNSDMIILVLSRPADALRTILSDFFAGCRCCSIVCDSIYQVLCDLEGVPGDQCVILVARPLMLTLRAASFLSQRFHNLRLIGWLDPNEHVLGHIVTAATESGMVLVSCSDQLQQVIQAFEGTVIHEPVDPVGSPAEPSSKIDRLEYELCDDEINALLGAE